MPINAEITIDDAGMRALPQRLHENLRDSTPAIREISDIMITASMRAFAEKADLKTGSSW